MDQLPPPSPPQHWYQSFVAPRPWPTLIKAIIGACLAALLFSDHSRQSFFVGWMLGVFLNECGVKILHDHPHRGAHMAVMVATMAIMLVWLSP